MKQNIIKLSLIGLSIITLSSCGSIFGGRTYKAHVTIENDSDAKIFHNGRLAGEGTAVLKVPRRKADELQITVKKENCEDQTFNYYDKTFRGWSLAGSIVTWSGFYYGLPIPWGVALDGINGAWWKPDVDEPGVSKENFNNFNYQMTYEGCK